MQRNIVLFYANKRERSIVCKWASNKKITTPQMCRKDFLRSFFQLSSADAEDSEPQRPITSAVTIKITPISFWKNSKKCYLHYQPVKIWGNKKHPSNVEIFLIGVWNVLKPSAPCSKPAFIESLASCNKANFSRGYLYPKLEIPGFWLLCVLFLSQCYFSSISAPTSYLNSPGCLHLLPNSLYTLASTFFFF